MSEHPEEAMDFLNYVAETSKAWDEPNPREAERMRLASTLRGGMYSITEDMEMKAKLSTSTRRLEELEMRNHHEVRAVTEVYLCLTILVSLANPMSTKESIAQSLLQ